MVRTILAVVAAAVLAAPGCTGSPLVVRGENQLAAVLGRDLERTVPFQCRQYMDDGVSTDRAGVVATESVRRELGALCSALDMKCPSDPLKAASLVLGRRDATPEARLRARALVTLLDEMGDRRSVLAWDLFSCLVGRPARGDLPPKEARHGAGSRVDLRLVYSYLLPRSVPLTLYVLSDQKLREASVAVKGRQREHHIVALASENLPFRRMLATILLGDPSVTSLTVGGRSLISTLVAMDPEVARMASFRLGSLPADALVAGLAHPWFAAAAVTDATVLGTVVDRGTGKVFGELVLDSYPYLGTTLVTMPQASRIRTSDGFSLRLKAALVSRKASLRVIRDGSVFEPAFDPWVNFSTRIQMLIASERQGGSGRKIIKALMESPRFKGMLSSIRSPEVLQLFVLLSPSLTGEILRHPGVATLVDKNGISPVHIAVLQYPEMVDTILASSRLCRAGMEGNAAPPIAGDSPAAFMQAMGRYFMAMAPAGMGRRPFLYHPGDTPIHTVFRNAMSIIQSRQQQGQRLVRRWLQYVMLHPSLARLRNAYGETVAHVIAGYVPDGWKALKKAGLLTSLRDGAGMTPLHYAAYRFEDAVRYALEEEDGKKAWLRDGAGRTVAHMAASSDSKVKHPLLELRGSARKILSARDGAGFTVAHYIALDPTYAKYVLQRRDLRDLKADDLEDTPVAAYAMLASEEAALFGLQNTGYWNFSMDGRPLVTLLVEKYKGVAAFVMARSGWCRRRAGGTVLADLVFARWPSLAAREVVAAPLRCYGDARQAAARLTKAVCAQSGRDEAFEEIEVALLEQPDLVALSPRVVGCILSSAGVAAIRAFVSHLDEYLAMGRAVGLVDSWAASLSECQARSLEVARIILYEPRLASLRIREKMVSLVKEGKGGDTSTEAYRTLAHIIVRTHQDAARSLVEDARREGGRGMASRLLLLTDSAGMSVAEAIILYYRPLAWKMASSRNLVGMVLPSGMTVGHAAVEEYPEMGPRLRRLFGKEFLSTITDRDGTTLWDVISGGG